MLKVSYLGLAVMLAIGCGAEEDSATDSAKLCHDNSQSFYCDSAKMEATQATTPTGKSVAYVYANGSSGFKVWKEVNGERVLRANGGDEWAKKLNINGKGQSSDDFTDVSSIAGIACPTNVYIDDSNKLTTDNCVYYTANLGEQALNKAGSSQTDINTLGMEKWNAYTDDTSGDSDPRWYVGNIKTCADKGMRLPTLYETSVDGTDYTRYHPTSDGTPMFTSTKGVSSESSYTWTASAYTLNTTGYWLWRGSSSDNSYGYTYSGEVVCVLP